MYDNVLMLCLGVLGVLLCFTGSFELSASSASSASASSASASSAVAGSTAS